MRKKKNHWVVVAIVLFFLPFNLGEASEVQQVETNGTVGFTGVYEPIGTPEPIPPITEVIKPDGQLPQTNTVSHPWLMWLGLFMVSLVFYSWGRKKQRNQIDKKVGTII